MSDQTQAMDNAYMVRQIKLQQSLKKEKKERDLTQSFNKNPYTNRKVKRAKGQHKQCHKKFDYTAIADRLRMVIWVTEPNKCCFNGWTGSIFPLTSTAV